jgi:uncharacterized membrane protein SpoIIM required for sporulation
VIALDRDINYLILAEEIIYQAGKDIKNKSDRQKKDAELFLKSAWCNNLLIQINIIKNKKG